MENSFYSPTFLIYKEVCVLRAVTWVLGSSHNLKDRCLSCQRVESPLEDLQLAVEDSGLCTPLLITHWLKLVTCPSIMGGARSALPPLPGWALHSAVGNPHDSHTSANLNPLPCFLEPFLPAPSPSLIELVQLVPKPLACIANIALPSRGFVKWMRVSVSSWPVRTSRTCCLIHSSEHSAQHIRCLINEVFMEWINEHGLVTMWKR